MIDRELIRQALANSEAVWHHGWRLGTDAGELVIPVDVAADIVVDLLKRSFADPQK